MDSTWSSTLSLYHLDEGNTHLINQQYKASIDSYTNCILSTGVPSSPAIDEGNDGISTDKSSETTNIDQREFITFRAYSHRAESYLQLKDYTNAKNDILQSHSVFLPSSNSKDNDNSRNVEIGMSFIRLGKAQFELKEYKSSLESFDRAAKELKLVSTNDGDGDDDGNDHSITKSLILEYKKRCEQKLENIPVTIGDVSSVKAQSKPTNPPATVATASATTTTSAKPPKCPKYQYYQNETFMTVSILEPNLDATKVKVDFSLDKLTVIVQKGGQNFTVICGTLFSAVIVSKCKVKYMNEKVLIKLKKKHKHDWHTLFGGGANEDDKEEEQQRLERESVDAATANAGEGDGTNTIPTIDKSQGKRTPYASHRDWDAIEKNLKREEDSEKPEGEGAFNKFLQSIYKDADEDTRRAMIKSYQTSGGTHLSCDWKEVSNKDYEKERTAPKGQEWKNWEGKKLPMKDDV